MTADRSVRITVDLARCVGSTICVQLAPRAFALDAGRQSTVIDAGGEATERILEAAEGCPVSAISVEDTQTGKSLFP